MLEGDRQIINTNVGDEVHVTGNTKDIIIGKILSSWTIIK